MDIMIKWTANKDFDDGEYIERCMDIVKYLEWFGGRDERWMMWSVNRILWYREFGNLDGYND